MELAELGQSEGIAHARSQDLEHGAPSLEVECRDKAFQLRSVFNFHIVEHAKQRPRAVDSEATRASGWCRQERDAHLALAARTRELNAHRSRWAMGVAHDLAVHVQDELLDRGVHLHRLELELDARDVPAPSEKDVTDHLSALELHQRCRFAHGGVLESPGLLARIHVGGERLLEEAVHEAAGCEEAPEILCRDVRVAAADEWIAVSDRLDAEVGDLSAKLGVDALAFQFDLCDLLLNRLLDDLASPTFQQPLEHPSDGLGLSCGLGAELAGRVGRGRRLSRIESDFGREQVLVVLAQLLDEAVYWRRPGAAPSKFTDVFKLVIHRGLHERVRVTAGNDLTRFGHVLLSFLSDGAGPPRLSLRRNRERRLARDGLHQRLERRVGWRRQRARDLDGPGEIPIADHRDLADELAPGPPVVIQIEPLDGFREAGGGSGTCERVATATQDPGRLLGQAKSGRVDALGKVLVVAVLGVEARNALGERLSAAPLED